MENADTRVPSSPRGIGFYLVALIMLAVVPLLVIAGVLVVRQGALQREAFDRSLLQTSFVLSLAVDRQMEAYRVMLETLAQADELRGGRIDAFHELSARVAEEHGALFISLFDRQGNQLFNTLRRSGVALPTPFRDPRASTDDREGPPFGDPTWLKLVLETGQSVNSDLLYGLVAQRLLFTVNIPIIRDSKVAYVLNAAFTPEVMTKLLMQNAQFAGVPAVIYDRRGFIVGRWKDADKFVGKRATAFQFEEVRRNNAGIGKGVSIDGIPMYFSYARSPVTGWGVNIGVERAALDRDIHNSWIIGGMLASAGFVLGVLMAMGLASRLRSAIVGLADSASRDQPPHRQGLRTLEIAQLESALVRAASAREAQAQERESRLVAEARNAEAEEANRVKDQFIAMMSHELRNPLAPIRNSVQMLRNIQARGDDAALGQIVDMLDRQSGHLTRLVNDLLDISRIRSGKIGLRREPADLCLVARHAAEAAAPALAARSQRLISKFPAHPVKILGDFARLSQVVSNLLDNAVKFTPPCGAITVSIVTEGASAVLTVKDNGEGIEAALLPRVFGPYIQGEGGSHADGGLGLGLALAKALTELHGGTIDAHSDGRNCGSTFTVRLPIYSKPSSNEEPGPLPGAALRSQAPLRVLVVDDNVDAATSLAELLRAMGHETRIAHDGVSALGIAPEFSPNVVLLDIGMPGLDGYEVARRLRAREKGRLLRIVALTGWGQEADRKKSQEAGFDLHMVKPIDMNDLIRALAIEDTQRQG